MAVELKYQTFWRRFSAALLDGMILVLLAKLSRLVKEEPESFSHSATLGIAVGVIVANYAYSIIFHAKFGQTPGKMLCRVKVLSARDGTHITFVQAIRRDLVPILLSIALLTYRQAKTAPGYLALVAENIALLWMLAELITMFTNRRRRAVHDLIAGTVVVREELAGEERFSHRIRVAGIWAVIVFGLSITFAWPHAKRWLLPEFVVIYRGSNDHGNLPKSQMWPLRLTTKIELKNHRLRNILSARIRIDEWLGSKGEDPMRGPLKCTPFHSRRGFWVYGVSYRGGSRGGSWGPPNDSERFIWSFGIDQPMQPARIAGRIEFWEAPSVADAEIETGTIEIAEGTQFKLGKIPFRILDVGVINQGPRMTFRLGTSQRGIFLSEVSHVDEDGKWMKADQLSYSDVSDFGIPYSHVCKVEFPSLPKPGKLHLRYWKDPTHHVVPFDFSDIPADMHQPVEPRDSLFFERQSTIMNPPSDSDWGDPIDSDALNLSINLVPSGLTPGKGFYPITRLDFRFNIESDAPLIATGLSVANVTSSAGDDWLRNSNGHLKSVGLWEWPNRTSPPASYTLEFPRLHNSDTADIVIEGTIRLAFGFDEMVDTIEVKDLTAGLEFPFPGVTLTTGKTSWPIRGNRGLIREITLLDKDGGIVAIEDLRTEEFMSTESRLYLSIEESPLFDQVVAIRVKRFENSRWVEIPFTKQLRFVRRKTPD